MKNLRLTISRDSKSARFLSTTRPTCAYVHFPTHNANRFFEFCTSSCATKTASQLKKTSIKLHSHESPGDSAVVHILIAIVIAFAL